MANNNNKNWKNNNSNNNNNNQKKRSGCKMTMGENKDNEKFSVITAWKVQKPYGIVRLVACCRKKDFECKTEHGEYRERWVCTIQKDMCKDETFTGFFNPNTKKLRIPDLNLVASPNSPNGGYFGKSIFKK